MRPECQQDQQEQRRRWLAGTILQDNPFYVFLESSRFCTFEKLVSVLKHHGQHQKDGEGRGESIGGSPFRQTYQGRNRTRFVHILDRLGGAEVVVGHCRLGAAGHSLSTLSPWHSSPTTYQHCIFFPTGPYRDS